MLNADFVRVDKELDGLLWSQDQSFSFAASLIGCHVSAAELGEIAEYAPVVFQRCRLGLLPFALFSLGRKKNAFVSATGKWLCGRPPTTFRNFPFCLAPFPLADVLFVRREMILKKVKPHRAYFFQANGDLSQQTQEVYERLIRHRADMARTAQVMDEIQRKGVLSSVTLSGMPGQANDFFSASGVEGHRNEIGTLSTRDLSPIHSYVIEKQVGSLSNLERLTDDGMAPKSSSDFAQAHGWDGVDFRVSGQCHMPIVSGA